MKPTSFKSILTYIVVFVFGTLNPVCLTVVAADDTEAIKAIVLQSHGNNVPNFWTRLNTNWAAYGDTKLVIDHTSFDHDNFTYDEIARSSADVVIVDDARNPQTNERYTHSEVDAIVRYVREGHGLIVTGGTLRPPEHWNLIPLLGYSTQIGGQVYFSEPNLDSIDIIVNHPELFKNLPAYATASRHFYSGSNWNRDRNDGYPSDWELVLMNPNAKIIAFIWNNNHLTNQRESSPISYLEESNYRAVFAGHQPTGPNATDDDYQFYYNAIRYASWLAPRVTVEAPLRGGGAVKFTANVRRRGSAETRTFTWDLGDGSPTRKIDGQNTIEHRYRRGGVYQVTVTVKDEKETRQPYDFNVQLVLPGDTDNDGLVDTADILPIGRYWKKEVGYKRKTPSSAWKFQVVDVPRSPDDDYWADPSLAYADTNGDGSVNAQDVKIIVANWGKHISTVPGASPPKPITEPASVQALQTYEEMLAFINQLPFSEAKVTLTAFLTDRIRALRRQFIPEKTQLLSNYPNPFNPETWIPYQLASDANVTLSIYTTSGQLVKRLALGHKLAGYYLPPARAAHWDGKNEQGETVANGVYFYTLEVDEFHTIRKMAILK